MYIASALVLCNSAEFQTCLRVQVLRELLRICVFSCSLRNVKHPNDFQLAQPTLISLCFYSSSLRDRDYSHQCCVREACSWYPCSHHRCFFSCLKQALMTISLLATQAGPLLLSTCRDTIAHAFLGQAAGPEEIKASPAVASRLTATVVRCTRAVCYSAPNVYSSCCTGQHWFSLLGTLYYEGLDHASEKCIQSHFLPENIILCRNLTCYLIVLIRGWDLSLPGWRWLYEPPVGVSAPCGAVLTWGAAVFVRSSSELQVHGNTSDPGIGR